MTIHRSDVTSSKVIRAVSTGDSHKISSLTEKGGISNGIDKAGVPKDFQKSIWRENLGKELVHPHVQTSSNWDHYILKHHAHKCYRVS